MTDRLAPNDHPMHDLLRQRWSPRSFTGAPVSAAQTASLLEAARWSASCNNEQPWIFISARRDAEPAAFATLLGLLTPNNQTWAAKAGLLMICAARGTFAANGKPNAMAGYDLGQAAAQMALQAVELGLASHQMRGFDVERSRTELALPEGVEPMSAMAFGPLGAPDQLPEALAAREVAPRSRKPIADFAHIGRFGSAPVG